MNSSRKYRRELVRYRSRVYSLLIRSHKGGEKETMEVMTHKWIEDCCYEAKLHESPHGPTISRPSERVI